MTRILILFAVIAVSLPGPALDQQEQRPQAKVSDEVKQMCRQEVRRLCRTGLIPNRAAIQRCIAKNKDKFPEQCLIVFQKN